MRSPEQPIHQPPAERQPIEETAEDIAYLGARLEKAKNTASGFVPERHKLEGFYVNDKYALELQQKIAIALGLGQNLLIEGGTAIGKTTTVAKMCAELGYELHYVNLNGQTDVENLMGRYIPNIRRKKETDPEFEFADGSVTSGLRQEDGKIKLILLDEVNATNPGTLKRLNEVLNAVEQGGTVILTEDAAESIRVSKETTKVVALMNPSGQGYLGVNPLSKELINRFTYQKEANELPKESFGFRRKAKRGLGSTLEPMPESAFISTAEYQLSMDQYNEIPGIDEIEAKYEEFHFGAKALLKERKVAEDQTQLFLYDDQRESDRVTDYVRRHYNGDINGTFQQALRYYYANKLETDVDKKKLSELIRMVEYTPKMVESKRRGLEKGSSRQSAAESLLQNPSVPDDIKERVRALEGKSATVEGKEGKATITEAETLMGDNFFGPEAIQDAFGIEIREIPPIQFSVEELERAQELGQQLILSVDSAPDGSPLTMAKMNELCEGKAADGKRLLYKWESGTKQEWYEKDEVFKTLTPKTGWRLVSPEVTPGSTGKNYIEQTQVLADYLANEVYKGQPLPEKYKTAIEEFQRDKKQLETLLGTGEWKAAGEKLEKMPLTSMLREDPAQALYRLIVTEKKSGKKFLANKWNWTATRSSDGSFVDVGGFGADGVGVDGSRPDDSGGSLGVCLSRS
jgi:MoxR-like ATPase